MKNFYYFYIPIIVLTQIAWVVLSSDDFEDTELEYLSHKLNPIECLRLLEVMYMKKPMTDEEYALSETKMPSEDESLLRRELERPYLSHENCRVKLEEWIHSLPVRSSRWARVAMETALRTLGRPDLAQYVKRSRRIVQYFDRASRNSKHAAKHPSAPRPVHSKTIQVTPAGKKLKDPPKKVVVEVMRAPEVSKATRESSILESRGEVKGAHRVGPKRIADDDSTTRWTAFLILLGIIALTVLATVFFALYKKNRGRLFPSGEKSCDDRCPLADRFSRKPSTTDVDVEQGTSTGCSPCSRRKKRGSSTQGPSRSPSSIATRENSVPARKPKKKKYVKEKQQKLEKRRRRRCDKRCAGIIKKEPVAVPKIEKSTKAQERKNLEKIQTTDPPKPRLDLKKFHEKIANILRKDDNTCKCCKCTVDTGDDKCLKNPTNKNICTDDKCQKLKLKSIAELCLSHEEKSPKKNGEDDSNKKKKEKKRKKEKDREKDTDKDKDESEKTSPDSSARSKDKRESKIREKKIKKGKYNVEGPCGRKTCHFRKSPVENASNVDKL